MKGFIEIKTMPKGINMSIRINAINAVIEGAKHASINYGIGQEKIVAAGTYEEIMKLIEKHL